MTDPLVAAYGLEAVNIPFVWLGYKQIGKSFAFYSILGIASLAVGTVLMNHVPTIIEGDTLLVTVVGGIIIGFGMGCIEKWRGVRWDRYASRIAVTEAAFRDK